MTTHRSRSTDHLDLANRRIIPTPPHSSATEPMLLDPGRCACHKPTLIATFRAERLVALELRHLRTNGCAYPAQAIDVETWRKPW